MRFALPQSLGAQFLGVLALGALAVLAGPALADATIDNTDRGAFRSSGFNKLAGSYAVRALNSGAFEDPPTLGAPVERERNYHTFDLSGLSGDVTGATLRVWVDAVDAALGSPYQSSDPFETVKLFDVSASAETLLNPTADNGGPDVFADLGTGADYGSLVVASTDAATYVDVALTAAAISDLNAAVGVGSWAVGGALDFDGSYSENSGFFSERVLHDDNIPSNDLPAQLVLTGSVVPEPAAALLCLSGLAGASGRRRR